MARLIENNNAVSVKITEEEMSQLMEALNKVKVHGPRYTPASEALIDHDK